jgi:hypothetical protein
MKGVRFHDPFGFLSPIEVYGESELVGVGGWVSLMMAVTVWGVLVVMVARQVTWCLPWL